MTFASHSFRPVLSTLPWLSLALLSAACTVLPPSPTAQAPIAAPASSIPAPLPSPVASASSQAPSALPALTTPAGLAPLQRQLQTHSSAVADAQPSRDLWDRIRAGFALPEATSLRLDKYIAFYAQRPDYIQRMTTRSEKYLYHVVQALHERQMPSELALLPFIESAFNPQALSRAKAAGMWQFIPSTGRHFNLTQNVLRDERRDVVESTNAALDYLQGLHKMFGDWYLALAAYNWGEGNVQRAVDRNRAKGLPADYFSLQRMPQETRDYVPKLLAVKAIVDQPGRFQISLPTVPNHPFFDAVAIKNDIDVAQAAKLADITEDEFRALNPSLKHPVILASGSPRILLPWENAARFKRNLASAGGDLASWTAWRVAKTASTATIAKQLGMAEGELRQINGIAPGRLVTAGSVLVVRRNGKADRDAPESLTDDARLDTQSAVVYRRAQLRFTPGETLAAVAKRYRLAASLLAKHNRLKTSTRLTAGHRLESYVLQRIVLDGSKTARVR